MQSRCFARYFALVACCCVSLAWAAKGERFAAEHKTFIAAESGLEIVQLTSDAADDSHLYFTSNGFLPGRNALVFASRRAGAWNLYLMDLASFEFTQLTDSRRISAQGAVVSEQEVFYVDGREVRATDFNTLESRKVVDLPAGYGVGSALSITHDGKTLAFSVVENIKLETKTGVLYSDMDEKFEKRPWSAVMVGKADGTGWHEVARQKKWISHVLISPTDPNLILYCHEGRWDKVEQRLWLVQADDTGKRMLRPEEAPELRIGHEFWFNDGVRVGYQSSWPRQAKRIGVADAITGQFDEYILDYTDGHLHAAQDMPFVIGDGTETEPFINLYRRQANGRYAGERLWRHGGSFAQQYWHPHPRISPDEQSVIFTSNAGGNGNVYLIRLGDKARAVEKPSR
jgi:oligogalacturonide lyase